MDGTVQWKDVEHPPFITVYHPICGWKAVMYVWVVYPDDGVYEPWQTGFVGHRDRCGAVKEAQGWAADEGIELRI